MAQVVISEEYLSDIAQALRVKLGTSEPFKPSQMANGIRRLPTAPRVISKNITANGTYSASTDGADGYSPITVNVANSYTQSDEGKVVNSGALVSQSSQTITQNGTYNTTLNNQIVANVPNTYAAGDEGKVVDNGALVAQTSKNINANGTHDTTKNNSVVVSVPNSYSASDEGKVVDSGSLIAQTSKSITTNGTYDTTTNNEVVVNVSGGGSTLSWRDTFSVNWDFSNPVNTRGASGYGDSGLIYTIDGWQLQGGQLSFVTGGIKLEQYASGTMGFFMQRYNANASSAFLNKPVTLSCIIDGELSSATVTMTSRSGQLLVTTMSGVSVRIYGYGSEIAVTFDIDTDIGFHIIQAIKLEAGSTQTLATQVNGAWVLNNSMDVDTEYIKAQNRVVYNSY